MEDLILAVVSGDWLEKVAKKNANKG